MSKLIYRVVSACGALGYGFPKASMDKAIEGRVDAIVSDAGSMDAGPYFLGTGTQYFEREAVRCDYTHMVRAGLAMVINAQTGIELSTERMMKLAAARNLCRMIVINKIDADNVDTQVQRILDTAAARQPVARYAHLATPAEIAENDFNLNIPRYVDTFEEEEEHP